MYHRSVFQAILDWTRNATKPFDHVFTYLARQGIATRVAWPQLAIQDVRHRSQIDPGAT